MDNNYAEYVDVCIKENLAELTLRTTLVEYHKNKHGNRRGVILAYKDKDNVVRIGVSLCNRKEKGGFNKHVGINKAMHSAVPITQISTPLLRYTGGHHINNVWHKIPYSLREQVLRMIKRACAYFKDVPLRPDNKEGEVEVTPEMLSAFKMVRRADPSPNEESYSFIDAKPGDDRR